MAAWSMQLLSGRLAYCSDATVFRQEDCRGVSWSGQEREWVKAEVIFN